MSETRDFILQINSQTGADASYMHCSLEQAQKTARELARNTSGGTTGVTVIDPDSRQVWFQYSGNQRLRQYEDANPESAEAVAYWLADDDD